MRPSIEFGKRLEQLQAAFEKDGFEVVQASLPDQHSPFIGLLAKHRTARTAGVDRKRAYYLEGRPWDMGYHMGRLAEPRIQEISEDYIENFIREMLPWVRRRKRTPRDWPIYNWLVNRVNHLAPLDNPPPSFLAPRIEEIRGMVAGCRSANARTEVTEARLWALNAGVDCLFSLFYQFNRLDLLFGRKIKKMRSVTACNALAVLNEASENGALFARDFMFPACGIFQDAAALAIYNPAPKSETLPFVSMMAPGFVGSIAALNLRGVAAGVNVVRSRANDPANLGINSLLLVRHAIESSPTIEEAAQTMRCVPRGVSWLYPMAADGGEGRDRACVVEAGATPRDASGRPIANIPFHDIPRIELLEEALLPSETFLEENQSPGTDGGNGVLIRWDDYRDPCGTRGFDVFNTGLWKRRLRFRLQWHKIKDQFGPTGVLADSSHRRRCPSGSYFAPLRGEPGRIVLTSNHYITPEMRLCTMDKWTNMLDARHVDDSQWRYDTLNQLVHKARWIRPDGSPRPQPRPLAYEDVKRIINFLEPACAGGDCPYAAKTSCYTYRKYRNPACKKEQLPIAIQGSVSVFDLKERSIESYFGYYGDSWVTLRLPNFLSSEVKGSHDEQTEPPGST